MQGLYSDSDELSRRTCGYLTRYLSIYAIQELTGVGESRKNAVLKLDERGSDHSYRFISIPAPEPLGNVDRFAARRDPHFAKCALRLRNDKPACRALSSNRLESTTKEAPRRSEKNAGIDVHPEAISIAVRHSSGKLSMQCTIESHPS
jgi:hypothetical protein